MLESVGRCIASVYIVDGSMIDGSAVPLALGSWTVSGLKAKDSSMFGVVKGSMFRLRLNELGLFSGVVGLSEVEPSSPGVIGLSGDEPVSSESSGGKLANRSSPFGFSAKRVAIATEKAAFRYARKCIMERDLMSFE